MRAEVENNVMLGIATALAQNPSLAKPSPYFATVHDDGDVVVCALRTPPHKLAISRTADLSALHLLAEDVFAVYPDLGMVLGPEPTVACFAEYWSTIAGTRTSPALRQRIYEARSVVPPDPVPPGHLRQASGEDGPTVTRWVTDFLAVMSEQRGPVEAAPERLRSGSLFVWDNDGPVSMAGWTGKTPNGVRVTFVYTPPEFRRHGYASACVAALTQRLLDEGNRYCCLYTDLANPTSNRIYQQIGYRAVCDVADYALAV